MFNAGSLVSFSGALVALDVLGALVAAGSVGALRDFPALRPRGPWLESTLKASKGTKQLSKHDSKTMNSDLQNNKKMETNLLQFQRK